MGVGRGVVRRIFSAVLCLVATCSVPGSLSAQKLAAEAQYPAEMLGGLEWRDVGPMRGGRTYGVAGNANQPDTFYFGSVGGGVWKTENAGRTWNPISDEGIPIGSIGAIAVAPSNPDIVYVGTGEPDIRSQNSYGIGMFKSADAGKTWTHIGLEATRQIGRVVVDPADPNRIYVAALGHIYDANPERGVYRSAQKVVLPNGIVCTRKIAHREQAEFAILAEDRRRGAGQPCAHRPDPRRFGAVTLDRRVP